MRISKFAIRDFLSLKDTGEVRLDPALTLLLGKNETGKTNLLLALESFDRQTEYEEDDLCRYSETRNKLDRGKLSPADVPMVTVWFDAETSDRRQLTEIDKSLQKAKTLVVTKYLDNHYVFVIDGQVVEDVAGGAEVPSIWNEIENWLDALGNQLREHASRHPPFQESLAGFSEAAAEFKQAVDQGLANGDPAEAFATLSSRLSALPNQDEPLQAEIANVLQELDQYREKLIAERSQLEDRNVPRELIQFLPRFVYFDDIDVLEDRVSIEEFLSNRERYKTLSNLMHLTGLDVERLRSQDPFQRREATERASARITGLVNESWTQERVTVSIGVDGADILIIVQDQKGGYGLPSARSKGFQWYLGFYINFNAGSEGELKNTILLLDDPGVHLHAAGQRDLLRTIEELSKQNQFVAATHSPFLIDRRHLERIRIVEKEEERRGTTFREKWYESKEDAFEPIRAALGMTIGDSLAVGVENVVVEGPSDFFILSAMSGLCAKLGRPCLDMDKVGIFPVDGASKVPYWTALIFKERLPVAAVLDHDKEGRKEAKRMVEELGIDERLVMTLEEFKSEPQCTDVELEDLIEAGFYYAAFEVAYADVFKEKKAKLPSLEDLPSAQCSRLKPYGDYFKARKLGTFDKMAVARAVQSLCADCGVAARMSSFASQVECPPRLALRSRGRL